jgi:hypothetical protein
MKDNWDWRIANVKHPAVFGLCNGHCWYCGVQLDASPMYGDSGSAPASNSYVVDHATPRIAGGKNEIGNYLPACWECNCSKGGRTVEQFRIILAWRRAGVKALAAEHILWLAENGIDALALLPRIEFWGEVRFLEETTKGDGEE